VIRARTFSVPSLLTNRRVLKFFFYYRMSSDFNSVGLFPPCLTSSYSIFNYPVVFRRTAPSWIPTFSFCFFAPLVLLTRGTGAAEMWTPVRNFSTRIPIWTSCQSPAADPRGLMSRLFCLFFLISSYSLGTACPSPLCPPKG